MWTKLLVVLVLTCMTSKAEQICQKCNCDGSTVDCSGLKLQNHFTMSDWPKDRNFTSATFENNNLVLISAFPPQELKYLSFKKNRIIKIDNNAFENLTNLTELDLSENFLTSVQLTPDIFKGKDIDREYHSLHNLTILRLGKNALHILNQDLFRHTPNIKVLSLDSNPLRTLEHSTVVALNSLQFLEVLDLAYTELKSLPDYSLHAFLFLRVLNLTGNEITLVPAALENTRALEELCLSENPILKIDGTSFRQEMTHLRILHMSYLKNLTAVSYGGFSNLLALEELYLHHCPKLNEINPNALSSRRNNEESEVWPAVLRLDISHNNLGSLDMHLLVHWENLQYLNLVGNPWVCDCENQWMVTDLLPKVKDIMSEQVDELTCVEPVEMKGRKLHDLETRHYHMRCLDSSGNHPEKDAKLLVGILIGVLIAVPLTIAAILLLQRTRFGTIFSRGPAEYSRTFYSRADSDNYM